MADKRVAEQEKQLNGACDAAKDSLKKSLND
jgi:hypothetical protein